MWERHNRRYDLLTPENCAGLLEGLRAQNRQEFPAIVRRVTDDPNFDHEVIVGARRHWSVSYLRNVEHRDFKYLIEERELTDEQAFRLADIENRARDDLSDYERAVDYLQAIEAYYEGLAQRMADRLEVKKSWLSRFLDLARLPEIVVAAFGDVHSLRVQHARVLKPLIEDEQGRDALLTEAARLGAQQAAHRARNMPPLEAPKVVQALQRAASQSPASESRAKPKATVIANASGDTLFTLAKKGRRTLVVEVPIKGRGSEDELLEALRREIAKARA